jgi:CheY-like chemotaxis protein
MMTETTPQTRVLLVEDEAILAMSVQDKLGDLGYAVPAVDRKSVV